MADPLYVLYTNQEMKHGSLSGIKLPENLERTKVISLKLPHIPKNTFVHAEMYAELHGARPYPFVALFHNHPEYGTSIQIPNHRGLEGFAIQDRKVIIDNPDNPKIITIDSFVDFALEQLGSTKAFFTNLVMDCTEDQHYRSELSRLEQKYQICELSLN